MLGRYRCGPALGRAADPATVMSNVCGGKRALFVGMPDRYGMLPGVLSVSARFVCSGMLYDLTGIVTTWAFFEARAVDL